MQPRNTTFLPQSALAKGACLILSAALLAACGGKGNSDGSSSSSSSTSSSTTSSTSSSSSNGGSSSGQSSTSSTSSSSSSSSSTSTSSSSSSSSSSSGMATPNACGVGYEAIGNGGWSACYRLQDGTAACNVITNPSNSQAVTWADGSPVTNVAHISAYDDANVVVVTTDGKAFSGRYSSVSKTPIINSGAISSTGGKHPMCILTGNANKKDVVCNHNGSLSRPTGLPTSFNPVQISSAYGFTCGLDISGDVWCWADGGNMGGGLSDVIKDTASKFPFDQAMSFISAGQNSVCGVQQSGGLKCKFSFYDKKYLPAKSSSDSLAETPDNLLPNIKAFHSTYGKGVAINKDGSVVYFEGQTTISGVGNAVAAGGHRDAMTVVNSNGDVYVVSGGNAAKVNTSAPAKAAACNL